MHQARKEPSHPFLQSLQKPHLHWVLLILGVGEMERASLLGGLAFLAGRKPRALVRKEDGLFVFQVLCDGGGKERTCKSSCGRETRRNITGLGLG